MQYRDPLACGGESNTSSCFDLFNVVCSLRLRLVLAGLLVLRSPVPKRICPTFSRGTYSHSLTTVNCVGQSRLMKKRIHTGELLTSSSLLRSLDLPVTSSARYYQASLLSPLASSRFTAVVASHHRNIFIYRLIHVRSKMFRSIDSPVASSLR